MLEGVYTRRQLAGRNQVNGSNGIRAITTPGLHPAVFALLQLAGHRPGDNVLDLACGAGAMSARLRDAGYHVTATDLAADQFELHDDVKFVQADLNQEFSNAFTEKFDAVIACEIIEHVENPRHFFRQIARLLRRGGSLVLSTPNVDSPFSKAVFICAGHHLWYADKHYKAHGHITPMSEIDLRRAAIEAGLVVEQVRSAGGVADSRGWWKMRLLAALLAPLCNPELIEQILLMVVRAPG